MASLGYCSQETTEDYPEGCMKTNRPRVPVKSKKTDGGHVAGNGAIWLVKEARGQASTTPKLVFLPGPTRRQ